MMPNNQIMFVRCAHCEKVVNFQDLDSHFCFKGDMSDHYFDTGFPDSIFVNNGREYLEIPWKSFKSIIQTPILNTLKKLKINPNNLTVL